MIKRYLLSGAVLLGAFCAATADDVIEYGDREFYGFFLSNMRYTNGEGYGSGHSGEYGFARQTFNNTTDNELIYRMDGSTGVYAAVVVDGIYYFAPYNFVSSLEAPKPLPLQKLNIATGEVEEVGDWTGGDETFKIWDMTYDLKNNRVLCVGKGAASEMGVYEMNLKDGSLTFLRGMNPGGGVIACDAFGRVFTIDVYGGFYQIDMSDSKKQIKLCDLDYKYLDSHQSLEFDLTTGKLYWASNCAENPMFTGKDEDYKSGSNKTWLVEIALPNIGPNQNYSAGEYPQYNIDEIGTDARFLGMYIPYCTGGFQAPGMATDIKAQSSEDGNLCVITFKAPTKTFGGEELTSLDGFEIYRDGEKIGSKSGLTVGGDGIFTDTNIPASGEYRYDIICYSKINGEGPKAHLYTYVGYDRPAAVSNINVAVNDNFLGTEITWEAPTAGAKGGTFNPAETKYDIVRLPDNVTVAKDLTETHYSDTFRRLLRYSYQVISKNDIGSSSAKSEEFIAGTPIDEFPYEETFDNKASALLKWQFADNNNDTQTWIIDNDFSHGVFGDYETSADYILSPTTVPENVTDADDWIISPPIAFGDSDYYIDLEIRSLTNELFKIYVGPKNNTASLTTLAGTFDLNEPQYANNGQMVFQHYKVQLPASLRNTIGCVGIRLATPLPEQLSGYVQVGNILIAEGDASSVAGLEEDNLSVYFDGKAVNVIGEYADGAVYNAAGRNVRRLNGSSTDLSDLPSGVYVVTVDGKSVKVVK